ncbi:hypothetical protein [Halorubrum sp. DTA98]|uniref:hypothetical protein n=1 Tax=Halorubrum sp. DTA98 TaxID=3402163 RepID=UPI003AAEBB98
MRFSHDRRGQSVVIGTVILFGFLIVAMAVYQAQVVPTENANVEFEHSQQVEGDFVDLRNALLSAVQTGDGRSTSVTLGTRYPQRTFFVNPPSVTGSVSTTESRELRVSNVTVDAEDNAAFYWDDRTGENDTITFDTRSLRYSPEYNELRDGPDLVYEHSLVVGEFDGAVLGRTGQTTVSSDRNRIRLTALDGDLSESAIERRTVDPVPISQSRRSVALNSTGDDPIVLELPTDVSMERADDLESEWERRLGANAESVTVADGVIRIELDGGEGYRLDLGKVGVGTGATVPNESDGYVVAVPSNDDAAVVEVRDRFNNPLQGANVSVFVDDDLETTRRTDDDGRAEFTPERSPRVEMTINDGEAPWEGVLFRAGTVGSGAGGDNINPSGETDIVLNDIGQPGNDVVELQFKNAGDEPREFREAEFTLYYRPQGATRETFTITGPGDRNQELSLRGGFQDLDEPFEILAGATKTMTFQFQDNVGGDLLGVSFRDDLNQQSLYLAGIEGDIEEGDGGGENGGDGGDAGDIEMRVDDLTRLASDDPEFYVSYDVGVDFDEIQISAEDSQNEFGASDQTTATDGRNGVTLEPGYDAGSEFAVTVTATEGGEVVAERTILTDADTQNPTENDDLSLGTSATLDASDIIDRTQTAQDNVRYRFDYDVSGTGSFSETQLHVVNRNGNGASGSTTLTQRSVNNADVEPGNGANTEYKLAILVVDADGAVVDDRIVVDVADGTDP